MSECHDTQYTGHLGVKKTLELIQTYFYWPTVQTERRGIQDVSACAGAIPNDRLMYISLKS